MRPRLPALFVLPVAVLLLSACGSARAPAAVVDGDAISIARLADEMALFTFLGDLRQQPCGQAQRGESADAACARFTLSTLIQEALIDRYAGEHDVTIADAAVNDAISGLEESLGGADELDRRLRAHGVTRPQFVAFARRLLLLSRTQAAIAEAGVTDEQLRRAYEEQREQFTQIHAKHILVKSRSLAQRIANEATPKNFGDLAKRYSIDRQSASNGGDLGTIAASSLDPAFAQAALALSPGRISGPVHTQFGWHVILLVSSEVQSLDEVKQQLSGSLQGQAFATWLRRRLASADIRVNPRYGRLDRTNGEVVPVRSTEAAPNASASAGVGSPGPASPSA